MGLYRRAKLFALGLVCAAATACSSTDVVTRNSPLEAPRLGAEVAPQMVRDYALGSIRFFAPQDLKVSESNSYYPIADIVWRGDPIGNRPEQISAIFQTSIRAAGETLTGTRPVTVDVQLARFHSITERTRYSVGGAHSIKFNLTILDAVTGEILEPTRLVDVSLPAFGGSAAIAADARGETQKVRITQFLTEVFRQELSGPTAATARPAAS